MNDRMNDMKQNDMKQMNRDVKRIWRTVKNIQRYELIWNNTELYLMMFLVIMNDVRKERQNRFIYRFIERMLMEGRIKERL